MFSNHITLRSTAILLFIGYGCFSINAQHSGFSKTYLFDERSTVFHAVRQLDDRLIIVGAMGTDSFGNGGVFVADMDTLGEVKNLQIFQDPENKETLALGYQLISWESVIISSEKKVVFSGTHNKGLNIFLVELDGNLEFGFFKIYDTAFPYARYVGSMLELFGDYYSIGFYKNDVLDYDIFLIKTNKYGNLIWEKSYGKTGIDDFSTSMIMGEDGLTILSSESRDPNALVPNDDIRYNSIFHIDTSGEILWTWKGELREEGHSASEFIKKGTDYYYITRPYFEENNTFHYKPQIVCRDKDFNLKWREDYGEFYHRNEFTSLTFGPDSFLYAAGYIPEGFTFGRVCKIDPENGDVIWDARDTAFVIPGWGSRNRMEGLTVLPSGSVIAVGYTVDHTFHENGLLYKVTSDGCIDTLCTTVAIEDLIKNPDYRVRVYPNPTTTDIFIDANISLQSSTLNIYYPDGRLIESILLTGGKNHIAINPILYKPGLYIWQALSEEGRILDEGKIYIHQ